jgi:hypothetical protein
MEDYIKSFVFAMILFSLFGLLVITVLTEEAEEYGKDANLVTGNSMNLSKFNEPLTNFQSDAEDLNEQFKKKNPWSALAGVVVTGIFDTAYSMIQMILFPFNIVKGILENVFQVPAIVTSVIQGLMVLGIIFGVWYLIKQGN